MSYAQVLSLIGGLCLFLFGMNVMGDALEKRAGGGLKNILGRLTGRKITGLLTGLVVTGIIQSSSATTVMVVGFVNSGLMSLKQAIGVIMGANVGTTVTAWILSLGGISGDNPILALFKPSTFTPILALVGIALTMFAKSDKKKDVGTILLGFATLMFGMDTMSASVKGLAEVPEFANMFLMFENPILGVLVGALLTAVIQSSSASVGILQALSATGQVSLGAAIPIIMGQNIGTCITAILSSFGTNRNAKRAALVHLSFNIIGTVIMLTAFIIVKSTLMPAILAENATHVNIATAHSFFNIGCTVILFPMSSLLEKLALWLIPDKTGKKEAVCDLDERLLQTPSVALKVSGTYAAQMAKNAVSAISESISCFKNYSKDKAELIRFKENEADSFEDSLGTYLVRLSGNTLSGEENAQIARLLKAIGDLERISDHSVNLLDSFEELSRKEISLSKEAEEELGVIFCATEEILNLTLVAFTHESLDAAYEVEPLEQVIDKLKERIRSKHILRLQKGECTIEAGFIFSDLLTNLERVSDHCSNIAGGIIDLSNNNMNMHEALNRFKSSNTEFKNKYEEYKRKYSLSGI